MHNVRIRLVREDLSYKETEIVVRIPYNQDQDSFIQRFVKEFLGQSVDWDYA